MIPAKAVASDFTGRFREIVSDPLNLLIDRVPAAGTIVDGDVILHNGNRVPYEGKGAYYGAFSQILAINRGVHEPLEEFAFQAVLRRLGRTPVMIELGAYWGHYSMWLKRAIADARVVLVEPDPANLEVGRANFARNGMTGEFVKAFVGASAFQIDAWMERERLTRLDILHSDIQGYEGEMIAGAAATLRDHRVDYAFVSTHSSAVHVTVRDGLAGHGYRIEADSEPDLETTSFDGFILAVRPDLARVLPSVKPMGRADIAAARPSELLGHLVRFAAAAEGSSAP